MEDCSAERLVMYHVVNALHKHACKAAFFETSGFATKSRTKYDALASNFVCELDSHYEWVDPAIPLLKEFRKTPRTQIFDSHNPSLAPHIVVTSAPPEDHSIARGNYPPCPQDRSYGKRLTVTACMMPVVNACLPPSIEEDDAWDGENYGDWSGDMVEDDGSDSSDEEDEAPTPKDEDMLSVDYEPLAEEDVDDDEALASAGYDGGGALLRMDSEEEKCTGPFGWQFEPDEDNELPPFDAWYLSRLPCS